MQKYKEAFKESKAPHRPALFLLSVWADLFMQMCGGKKILTHQISP